MYFRVQRESMVEEQRSPGTKGDTSPHITGGGTGHLHVAEGLRSAVRGGVDTTCGAEKGEVVVCL